MFRWISIGLLVFLWVGVPARGQDGGAGESGKETSAPETAESASEESTEEEQADGAGDFFDPRELIEGDEGKTPEEASDSEVAPTPSPDQETGVDAVSEDRIPESGGDVSEPPVASGAAVSEEGDAEDQPSVAPEDLLGTGGSSPTPAPAAEGAIGGDYDWGGSGLAPIEHQDSGEEEARKKREIANLESKAKLYFRKYYYTTPKGTNVLEVARQIMALDEENTTIRELLAKIGAFYQRKGFKALDSGDFQKAVAYFQRLKRVDLWGERRVLANEKIAEARAALAGKAETSPEELLQRAEDALARKDYRTAKRHYQAILKLIPDDILARQGLEMCYEALGVRGEETPEAVRDRVNYFRGAAENFFENQKYTEAKFYYGKILALRPDDSDAKAKIQLLDDLMTPKGRVKLEFEGDSFWWSAKVDPRVSTQRSKTNIEVIVRIDGDTVYYLTDSEVEHPAKKGKKGHAKNIHVFSGDYLFDDVPAGRRKLEIVVRGGAGEESKEWVFDAGVDIAPGVNNILRLRTREKLKYSRRKGRMSGVFQFRLVETATVEIPRDD